MNGQPPAFQFYPKDFLSDEKVISMTMEERGVYVTTLCMCWIEDGLEIGSRVVEGWFNQYPSVARCFYEKDGKFRNPRLDEERRKQLLWHDKSVKGGRKSAETRRLRKGGSTKGQPKVNQRSTLPSSPFPLPSSNEESRDSSIAESFEKWWKRYPRKEDKGKALQKWMHLVKVLKVEPQRLEDALTGYINYLNGKGTEIEYIKYASTFLFAGNAKKGIPGTWEQYLGTPAKAGDVPTSDDFRRAYEKRKEREGNRDE